MTTEEKLAALEEELRAFRLRTEVEQTRTSARVDDLLSRLLYLEKRMDAVKKLLERMTEARL